MRGGKNVDNTQGMIEGTKYPGSLSATASKLHLYTHLARLVHLVLDLLEWNVSYIEWKDVGRVT